nr:hypothetical protein [Tanacetum cinerariifolium]
MNKQAWHGGRGSGVDVVEWTGVEGSGGKVAGGKTGGEPIPTMPFVTSSVSATPECEGEGHTDSVTGLNLQTISAPQSQDMILVIVNHLITSAYFLPIKEKDSMEKLTRQFLKEVVSRHRVPVLIISDRESRVLDNNNYHTIIKAAPLEALYGQDADVRRMPLEFQVGDMVMLKVSPWKGMIHFGKRGKLNPHYIRPFKILAKVGIVAYRLKLPEQLRRVYSTFHVSNLKKCLSNETQLILLDEIHIDDKLHFIKIPIEIMYREVKLLKQSHILIVKLLDPRITIIKDLTLLDDIVKLQMFTVRGDCLEDVVYLLIHLPEFAYILRISSIDGQSCSGQTPDIAWEGFQKKSCVHIKCWLGKRFSCKIDGAEVTSVHLTQCFAFLLSALGAYLHICWHFGGVMTTFTSLSAMGWAASGPYHETEVSVKIFGLYFRNGLRESVSHLPILTDSIILVLVLSSLAEEVLTDIFGLYFRDGLRELVSHLPILTDSIILILVLSSLAEVRLRL